MVSRALGQASELVGVPGLAFLGMESRSAGSRVSGQWGRDSLGASGHLAVVGFPMG
jgi:hypothetical protein